MKKLITAFILTTVLFAVSCKKPAPENIPGCFPTYPGVIAGTWVWKSTKGYFLETTPEHAKENITLILTENYQFNISINNKFVLNGVYDIKYDENKVYIYFNSTITNFTQIPYIGLIKEIQKMVINELDDTTLMVTNNDNSIKDVRYEVVYTRK